MFRNLWVAVESFEHARRTPAAPAEFAHHSGASPTSVHVLTCTGRQQVPEEPKDLAALEHLRVTGHEIIVSAGQEKHAMTGQQARDAGAGGIATVLEPGQLSAKFADIARREDIDLIVMGRLGVDDLDGAACSTRLPGQSTAAVSP